MISRFWGFFSGVLHVFGDFSGANITFLGVFLFLCEAAEDDIRLIEHFEGKRVGVFPIIDDFCDAGVDQHLGTEHTGLRGGVQRGAFDIDAVARCLDKCVLLGMKSTAQLMLLAGGYAELLTQATAVKAMLDAGGHTVVTSGKQTLVLDDDSAYLAAATGRAARTHMGDVHEVLIPTGA